MDSISGIGTVPAPEILYLEITNLCNLRCSTCVRSFFALESPKYLSAAELEEILPQFPRVSRALLHGLGEPLLHPDLEAILEKFKSRGIYTLFNTNANLLDASRRRIIISAPLDELRVSLDTPDPGQYAVLRPGGDFAVVMDNLKALQAELQGKDRPKVSLWMTGGRKTLKHLPDFIKLASQLQIPEVYIQRLICFGQGNAVGEESLYGSPEMAELLLQAQTLADNAGITLSASGAAPPSELARTNSPRNCRRPWTTAYITANGNVLPCCLYPFSYPARYPEFMFGNIFRTPWEQIWNSERMRDFRQALASGVPPECCARCGQAWSL